MKIKQLFILMVIVLISGCNMNSDGDNNKLDTNITTIEKETENTYSSNYIIVSDYLRKEAENTFSPYYELLDFKISNYNEKVADNNTEILLDYTIIHKNYDKDPDTVDYIRVAKENNDSNYETLYKEYLEPKEMNMEIKVIINKDGKITLYTDTDPYEGRDWAEFKMSDCIIKSDDTAK